MKYKYYCVDRAPTVGMIPTRGLLEAVNYGEMKLVECINAPAYGEADYVRRLTKREQEGYGMVEHRNGREYPTLLYRLREEKGLTRKWVAEQIGTSAAVLGRLETGEQPLSRTATGTVYLLASILGTTIEELLS